MLEKDVRLEDWPESRVKVRPLTGPRMWDLSRSGMGGDEVYRAFAECVVEWENVPLLGGAVSESLDLAQDVLNSILPGFVIQTVTEAMKLSTLAEDERKN